jgi:dephospho-CoA kinase
MLRVGLTGDLGSGKSTVAQMLAERGAVVLSSDEMARALMQPGTPVFGAIVAAFGEGVLSADGSLDRRKLAELAFDAKQPRVEELNAIVHPAVLAAQAEAIEELGRRDPRAIVVVESALIFSTAHGSGTQSEKGSWRWRFDRVLLVEAPEEMKIARFVERMAGGRELSSGERAAFVADARRRLALQHETSYGSDCLVLRNDGDMGQLEARVGEVWVGLQGICRG